MTRPLPSAEVFIATSFDGYIARPDGGLDWLVDRPVPQGEDYGYAAFIDGVGALIMGRQSFDKALSFPEWPYQVPVIVMSRSPERVQVPESLQGRVEVTGAAPRAVLANLAAPGMSRVYVDGGQIIRAFLEQRLIRRMIVTQIPVLLGEGRPLWGHGAADVPLALRGVRQWPNGFVQVEYGID
jgi:dihydrofolate reductase